MRVRRKVKPMMIKRRFAAALAAAGAAGMLLIPAAAVPAAAQAEEDLRQGFAAEVAHELGTPLTILRSQVEGLRVGVLQPGPEALGSLDEEVQRMSRLVADL
jgi:signal transduction histidine kinase